MVRPCSAFGRGLQANADPKRYKCELRRPLTCEGPSRLGVDLARLSMGGIEQDLPDRVCDVAPVYFDRG